MWQGWRVRSFIQSFIFHPITRHLIVRPLVGVSLNRAWPTRHWGGSGECSYRLRTSWTQQSVPPRTWRRWVLGGWGRTASCHPGRPGSEGAGAGRRRMRRRHQSRRRPHRRPGPLPSSSGRARARYTSSPPAGCPAAGRPTARQRGGMGGRSTRGAGGRWGGEALTPWGWRGFCSFQRRPDTGSVL